MGTLHEEALRERVRKAREAQEAAVEAEDAEAFDLASEEMAEARRIARDHGVSVGEDSEETPAE
ncbi:hypothetical protein [Phaeacidiphilus oryzae]|jgi:sugar phosphate isomerase/epimerase|uniref:hypothetical protein n=1 Tax=Phaeacidiphilus oryzae TaxID=348818 RepID=UPI00056B1240|nr:hypothetical protein [Phaeacidiphilus oryzae]